MAEALNYLGQPMPPANPSDHSRRSENADEAASLKELDVGARCVRAWQPRINPKAGEGRNSAPPHRRSSGRPGRGSPVKVINKWNVTAPLRERARTVAMCYSSMWGPYSLPEATRLDRAMGEHLVVPAPSHAPAPARDWTEYAVLEVYSRDRGSKTPPDQLQRRAGDSG